jgi:hypothetical protein
MSNKAYKGGNYERDTCRSLSRWWTGGKRDDIFWRSSQSGGRATERAKKGKTTFGSYGDIAAVDPIGRPLLEFATIELKRGSSHKTPWDLFESSDTEAVRPFEKALCQARQSSEQAGSRGWLLIARRDHKVSILYLDHKLYLLLKRDLCPSVRYSLWVNQANGTRFYFKFVAFRLEDWLRKISPQEIIKACE